MDFVIVGIVIGAGLVGVGALLRDLGPRLRPRLARPDRDEVKPDALALAWAECCHAIGMAVTALGFLLVVATAVLFFGNVSAGAGWLVVGAASALALVGSAASTVHIGRRYQRGEFDGRLSPAPRAESLEPANLIIEDRLIPLGSADPLEQTNPEASSHVAVQDAFAQAVGSVAATEPAGTGEPPFAEAEGSFFAELDPLVEARLHEADLEPFASVAGVETAEPAVVERPAALGLDRKTPDDLEPQASSDWGSVEPVPHPVETGRPPAGHEGAPPSFGKSPQPVVLSSLDSPLIDPDDELPAWDDPPIERVPAPVVYTPVSGAAFESALLADLRPATAPESADGPFQSRLLNELTTADGEAGGRDVLVAESPAVDSSRGARQG